MHRIKQEFEFWILLQEQLDRIKVEYFFHQRDVVGHRIDDRNHHSTDRGRANEVKINLIVGQAN